MFGDSFPNEKTRSHPSRVALGLSLLVHLLLATAFWVNAPRLTVGDGSGGPIPIVFAGSAALRASRGGDGIRLGEERKAEIPPWAWPRAARSTVPFSEPVRVAEGTATGADTGLPNGTGQAAPRGGDLTAPQVLMRIVPAFPTDARLRQLEGSVVVETVIDEEGNPTEVRLIRGILDSMDAAALEAVRRWRFRPATRNGKPVRVAFRVTVDFRL